MRIEVSGRLATDPRVTATKDGRPFSGVCLDVSMSGAEGEIDGPPVSVVVPVLAYGAEGELLAQCVKGDMVSVAGRPRSTPPDVHDGLATVWECVADSVEPSAPNECEIDPDPPAPEVADDGEADAPASNVEMMLEIGTLRRQLAELRGEAPAGVVGEIRGAPPPGTTWRR